MKVLLKSCINKEKKMKLVKTISELRTIVKQWKKDGLTVGLVPTMGYLHEGHKSLITRAVAENDRVVVSDFVNPTQFAPNEDFESYPRDIEADCKLCEDAGAAVVFNPEADEMYTSPLTSVNMTEITEVLCGKTRPTHFGGVCTVVSKLFNIVTPDRAYFGQKDAQQLCVIKKMVQDLNFDIEIVGCPIVREADGLAKSSRNTYLSAEERKAALCLSRSLKLAKSMLDSGETDCKKIIEATKAEINTETLAKIDYVEMVDLTTLKSLEKADRPMLMAMAVYIGKTRLIDNFITE
jgi:pantoate--beta-alanine ligase